MSVRVDLASLGGMTRLLESFLVSSMDSSPLCALSASCHLGPGCPKYLGQVAQREGTEIKTTEAQGLPKDRVKKERLRGSKPSLGGRRGPHRAPS
jgi:hypothetical protein